MVNTQKTIRLKPLYIFLLIALLILGFISLIHLENKRVNKYIKLNYQMKIDSTLISGDENYGLLRGAVFFKRGYFIGTSARLIENNCGFNSWKSNGPIVDFNKIPHEYTLDDLGLPFVVYKDANNDTIFVDKSGCLLKFILQ